MAISVNLVESPVSVTVSANAGSVSVSAATVSAVSVGIGDVATPLPHAASHAYFGTDPISADHILINCGVTDVYNEDDTIKTAFQAIETLFTLKDSLSTVATSGSAADLSSGTLQSERLPKATTSAAGAMVVGSGLSVDDGTVNASVTSVAGRTGVVTLTSSDIGGLNTLLAGLSDVSASSAQAGDVLRYNGIAWTNYGELQLTDGGNF